MAALRLDDDSFLGEDVGDGNQSSYAESLWEGLVSKQGGARGGFKNWRRRWLRITLEDLCYYKPETDGGGAASSGGGGAGGQGGTTVLGVMPMRNATIVDYTNDADSSPSIPDVPSPVWDLGATQCFDCGHEFSAVWRRRFCRACGLAHCSACSPRTVPVSRFGYFDPVRVCNKCFNGLTSVGANAFRPLTREGLEDDGSVVGKAERKNKTFEWKTRKYVLSVKSLERELFLQADTQTIKIELITVIKSIVLYHKNANLSRHAEISAHMSGRKDKERSVNRWALDYSAIKILQEVGGGAFGTVFKGRLWGTGVAVKKLKHDLSADDRENLQKEVSILSQLRHPNVVLYIGACLEPSNACIVTEWCERGSLFDALYSDDPSLRLDMQSIVQISTGIAQGMNYLHSVNQRIIHRDLKSHNILVDTHFIPKVADFGLSHVRTTTDIALASVRFTSGALQGRTSPTTQAPAVLVENDMGITGTAEWMAPEVMEGASYNQSVDVYSFGIVLTELLTRRLPFRDQYTITCYSDVVEAVLDDGAKPTIPMWAGSRLNRLVDDCLNRNPDERPTFTEIILRLRSFYPLDAEALFCKFDVPRLLEMLDSPDALRQLRAVRELDDMANDLPEDCQLCGHLPASYSYMSFEVMSEFATRLSSLLVSAAPETVVYAIRALRRFLENVKNTERQSLISLVRDAGGIVRLSSYLSNPNRELSAAASAALTLLVNDVEALTIMGLPLSALQHLQSRAEDDIETIRQKIENISEQLQRKQQLSESFEKKAAEGDNDDNGPKKITALKDNVPAQLRLQRSHPKNDVPSLPAGPPPERLLVKAIPKSDLPTVIASPTPTPAATQPIAIPISIESPVCDLPKGSFEGTTIPEQLLEEMGKDSLCWGWLGMLDEEGQSWKDIFAVVLGSRIYIFDSDVDRPEYVMYIVRLRRGTLSAKFRLGRKRGRQNCLQIAVPHELLPAAVNPKAPSMQRFFLHMGSLERYIWWLNRINTFLDERNKFEVPEPPEVPT